MKNLKKYLIIALLLISLFIVSCNNTEPDLKTDTHTIEAVLLKGNSVFVTDYISPGLESYAIISLNFNETKPVTTIGSLYEYELDDQIAESWPPQATVLSSIELKSNAGVIDIDFAAMDQILNHLPDNSYLIDVRTQEEYLAGHISGAELIELAELEEKIIDHLPEQDDIVILYCRSGNRSGQGAEILSKLGYKVVFNAGGISSYSGAQITGSDPGPKYWEP